MAYPLLETSERNRDVGVVLAELDDAAAIVEHAALMLAEPVKRLGGVGAEAVFDMKRPGRLRWQISARQVLPLVQQLLAVRGPDGQIAIALRQGNLELRGGEAS